MHLERFTEPVQTAGNLLFLPGLGSNPLKHPGPSMTLAQAYAESLGLDVVLLHTDPVPCDLNTAAMDVLAWETWRSFDSEPFQIIASSFGGWVTLEALARWKNLPPGYRGAWLIDPFVSVTKQAEATPRLLRAWAKLMGYKRKGEDGNPSFRVKASLVRSMLERDIQQSNWLLHMARLHPKHGVKVIITHKATEGRYYDPEAIERLVQVLALKPRGPEACPFAKWIGPERGGIAAYYA